MSRISALCPQTSERAIAYGKSRHPFFHRLLPSDGTVVERFSPTAKCGGPTAPLKKKSGHFSRIARSRISALCWNNFTPRSYPSARSRQFRWPFAERYNSLPCTERRKTD